MSQEGFQKSSTIDARTDLRWVQTAKSITERKDWSALWRLALTAPPIWTIRIIKHLVKEQWSPPPEEQADLFHTLKKHAAACNEYDLPSPDLRRAKTMKLENVGKRISAARITVDGEMIFVLDEKCAAIEIRRLSDLSEVSRIRLDMLSGKIYAPLAFTVTDLGNDLAVLVRESTTGSMKIHLYELDFGEVVSEKWLDFKAEFVCDQVPKLAFSNDAGSIFLQLGETIVCEISRDPNKEAKAFFNSGHETSFRYIPLPYEVTNKNAFVDWQNYGRHGMKDPASQTLSVKANTIAIPGNREFTIKRQPYDGEVDRYVWSSTGIFAFSDCGKYFATIDDAYVCVHNLTVEPPPISTPPAYPRPPTWKTSKAVDMSIEEVEKIANIEFSYCADPVSRLAISTDSEVIAIAMSHSEMILLQHIPDGRTLGTLYGLAHEVLLDFRFTLGGSIVAISKSGLVQIWEADGNGVAWPWSEALVTVTHHPVDSSSVRILRLSQEMRRRGWLSSQEQNILDLALLLMQNRLSLDIEIDFESELPGDIYDIEIED